MDTPDPEQASMWARWFAGAATFAATIFGIYKLRQKQEQALNERFDKKADKNSVNNALHKVETEQALHRSYFTKVFDQMRENEQRAQDRHERLMERLTK